MMDENNNNIYQLNKHNKKSHRVFIPIKILNKYDLKESQEIYYIIYIDENLTRHFYISGSKPEITKNIFYVDKKTIKKSALRSLNSTFYFDNTFNIVFDLDNKNFLELKKSDNDLFNLEFVFR